MDSRREVYSKSTGIVQFERGIVSGEAWLDVVSSDGSGKVIESHYTIAANHYVDQGDAVETGELLFVQYEKEYC